MAIQKHSIDGTDTAIWAETANLNHFTNTLIAPDSEGSVTNEQASVAASSRRQYPGDASTVSVSSHTRTYLVDPGRKSGSAIPGDPFRINDGTENRMMRFTGDWIDVHAFFTGNVKTDVSLYSPTGTRYQIAGPTTRGALGTDVIETTDG